MTRHLCIVVGRWKLENWRLYRWTPHQDARRGTNRWHQWDRVL